MDWPPVAIAVLSLFVAGATLFLTQLRAARITVHVGPGVDLGYDSKGNADVVLPTTFINESNRTGIVRSAAITLGRPDGSQPHFFIMWDDFMSYNEEDDEWEISEMAHALPIPSKSSVHKVIWFSWFGDQPSKLRFSAGEYELTFYWWEPSSMRPRRRVQTLRIGDEEFKELEGHRKRRDQELTTIPLDRTFAANMVLRSENLRDLLGP